jgi:hypothetical protein
MTFTPFPTGMTETTKFLTITPVDYTSLTVDVTHTNPLGRANTLTLEFNVIF